MSNSSTVASLADRRRARYLAALLAQRAHYAAITAEKDAHDVPDAHDHLQWLLAIEQAIEAQWPQLYSDLLPDWARDDAALMHTPPRRHPDCGICTGSHLTVSADLLDTTWPLAA
jgi:hypothetical protein